MCYNMKITVNKLNLDTSIKEIIRLSEKYYFDLTPFMNYSIKDFFDFVSNEIEYDHAEQKKGDVFRRPKITLEQKKGDCDCKTILILGFLKLKGYERGFSLVSDRQDKRLHHVFPFVIINGVKQDLDATYKNSPLNGNYKFTHRKDFRL